jgi:hypothetical protein
MAGREAVVNFLVPGLAMVALAAASIPWLLHLLLRRPRVTAWPSTLLLQRALERLRRNRRLDQWILLLCRSMALLIIGLGMAGPWTRTMEGSDSGELWIVIDDGAASAERLEGGGTVLNRLQEQACQAIDRLQAGQPVTVLAAGMPVTMVVERSGDHDRARQRIRDLSARPVPTNLPLAIERSLPTDAESVVRQVHVLSGFREGSIHDASTLDPAWRDRAQRVAWSVSSPMQERVDNTAIVAASLDRSMSDQGQGGGRTLRFRMARTGSTPARSDSIQVRDQTGTVIATTEVAWVDGSDVNAVEVPMPDGTRAVMVVREPDAQPQDDTIAVVGDGHEQPRVLLVGRPAMDRSLDRMSAGDWIERALEASNLNVQRADPASLGMRPRGGVDVVLVCQPDQMDVGGWSWIAQTMRLGGAVVLMPTGAETEWWNQATRELSPSWSMQAEAQQGTFRLASRQPRSRMFSVLGGELDVLGEAVRFGRRSMLEPGSAEVVLQFEDGKPAAVMQSQGSGSGVLMQLAFRPELDWTDLPLKPLMVPLLQEMVRSVRSISSSTRMMETGRPASLGPVAALGTLQAPGGSDRAVLALDEQGESTEPIERAGLWTLQPVRGESMQIAARLDPEAASIETVSGERISAWSTVLGMMRPVDTIPTEPAPSTSRSSPWTWPLLVAGLVLLTLESAWSRRGSPRSGAHGTVEPA